jgi:hypothetical protein
MAMFQPFKAATAARTPDYVGAEIGQFNADMQQYEAEKARREGTTRTAFEGADLYNKFMGDKTPIADALRGFGGSGAEAGATQSLDVLPTAYESMLGGATEAGAAEAALAGGGEAALAGGAEAALAGGAAEAALASGAGAAATGATGAGAAAAGAGAGSAGLMAALGPVGGMAALAMALGLFG